MDDADDTSDADADTAQFLVGFESIPVEDFWDPAEISDFSDEVFFGYYQTRGFPHGFGAATPQSTTDNAADIGADPINHTDATHNRAADLVLDIESLTVTDPVPTNVSSNEPVPTNGSADAPDSADVLDSKDASSVSSILEKQLKAEREKNKALEKELSSTQEALKKEKLYRQCGMCYERPTNTVTKCGHIFCGECVTSWQREHPQPFQTPCPMRRKPMGKTIRIFTE
ncbi:hypothetical protein BGZ61DRAFT_468935 [Ilyonectria robusta]|uniref:uncharacterized protein n=1 Tax=Ilyonectria robusta TaxID=1079257 RepID=UPI001E8DECB2|nr:uncharacterized protein BGZ61DRAFT_468935 [Ilyonectria robusta]KAH8651691.1 hypothetical protein BGZ61DRAFT_468935 [Ilyonectria robusta]